MASRDWMFSAVSFAVSLVLVLGRASSVGSFWQDAEASPNPEFRPALVTLQNAESGEVSAGRLAEAWKTVAGATFAELPAIFSAIDQATPLGANWLGMAVDRMVPSSAPREQRPPIGMLEQVATDSDRSLHARQLALELIRDIDPQLATDLQIGFRTDPQAEFRRPAIQAAMEQLSQQITAGMSRDEQIDHWRRLFADARDAGQAAIIARELERLGQPADLASHFGYVRHWSVLGPFDNTDGNGFDIAYEPETRDWRELLSHVQSGTEKPAATVAPAAPEHAPGATNASWQPVTSSDRNGNVDLNEVFGELKDVLAYGAAVIESDQPQDVEVRLRVQNAFKVWLNGEPLLEQPVGHTGNSFDQYTVKARLCQGDNLMLIKSCQVQPIQPLAFFDVWHFCVRLCDSTGGGLASCRSRSMTPPRRTGTASEP